MGVIISLVQHPTRLQRLYAAVRDRHTVVSCDGWAEVTRACETNPAHVAVLDLYADGALNFDRVRVLRDRFPRVALVAYVSLTADRARDMFDAGRVGVASLVVADVDDAPPQLSALIEKAEARNIANRVADATTGLRAPVRDAVLACVARAHERLTPERLSRLLAVPRRLLAKRLQDAGLPSPQRLLTWGRLLVAAHMLEDPDRSADSVAAALDFPSGSAFRNTCQRYLHSTPQEIRARGGTDFVLRAFLRQARRADRSILPADRTPGRARTPHLAV